MKLFKTTLDFDYSKAPNKHDYVLWRIQSKLTTWRIRLGTFGGLLLVIANSYYVITSEGLEFVFSSSDPMFNIGRITASLILGICYFVCFCLVFKYSLNQNQIFREVTKNGF